jgi:hypothetical protein
MVRSGAHEVPQAGVAHKDETEKSITRMRGNAGAADGGLATTMTS